jgi:hypothetical protein
MLDSRLLHVVEIFKKYKELCENAVEQVSEDDLHKSIDENSNSISIIMQHLAGNLLSRWTDFLISDGEKVWRERDKEFEEQFLSQPQLFKLWNDGWNCLFAALDDLSENDLDKIVLIRNEAHTVNQAILRQLGHYSYHTGQIVFLAKHFCGNNWAHLSMPKSKK